VPVHGVQHPGAFVAEEITDPLLGDACVVEKACGAVAQFVRSQILQPASSDIVA